MRTGEAQKSGTGELRSDTEPLTTRFPMLDGLREVKWMSGTYGDARNPGPSTYWIDAVITLDPGTIDKLTSTYAPDRTDRTPTVVDGMRSHLPPGPFLAGDGLDKAFAHDRWSASAYLDPQAGRLVLVATGT